MALMPVDIDDAVTLAVDKTLIANKRAKKATKPKRKQKPSETDVNLDAVRISDIVAQIVVAIQSMIMKFVTEAINDYELKCIHTELDADVNMYNLYEQCSALNF